MSRDADNIMRNMLKKQEEMNKNDDHISKDIVKIQKEIKNLHNKIDLILDILNNLTIMVLEEDELEDGESYYDEDNGWTPEQSEDWDSEYTEGEDEN